MFRGIVDFTAHANDCNISFPDYQFTAPEGCVVTIGCSRLGKVSGTVEFKGVVSEAAGCATAKAVVQTAFNRLSFSHGTSIGAAEFIAREFVKVDDQGGPTYRMCLQPVRILVTPGSARLVHNLSPESLKNDLQPGPAKGETYFGLFRTALNSSTEVEEFLLYYFILQTIFGDKQRQIDDFVVSVEPLVPQTQSPNFGQKVVMETLYTRLRNELSHSRPGTDIERTKREMAKSVSSLRAIVKQAISRHG